MLRVKETGVGGIHEEMKVYVKQVYLHGPDDGDFGSARSCG